MSLEDPFFVVKDEVFKALNKTRGLYLRWRELGTSSSGAEADWTTTELRNSLRSIEWDLEDLEDTIAIVEKNPNKFKIDNKELSSRRHFIDTTRDEVKSMKDKMSMNRNRDRDITAREPLLDNNNTTTAASLTNSVLNSAANMASRHSGTKYSKLENSLDSPAHYARIDSPTHNFSCENVASKQSILQGQEEHLDVISDSVGSLKTVSRQIGMELDEQAIMLDDFGNEMESTESKIDTTMKKVAKVLHITNDKRQWMAIFILSLILLVVVILFLLI